MKKQRVDSLVYLNMIKMYEKPSKKKDWKSFFICSSLLIYMGLYYKSLKKS